jgi:putative sigma-54 modulation protein
MKVTYTGKMEGMMPVQRRKLEAKLAKLGKFLDGKEEREAHVIVTSERHVQRAEITVNYYNHPLVGIGAAGDLLTAVSSAIEKLEKQVLKSRAKWRDTKRDPQQALKSKPAAEPAASVPESESGVQVRVFRANHRANQKPLTLEEAMLAMEDGRTYLVYRDAESDRLSVLLRRRDGHFDLVEA